MIDTPNALPVFLGTDAGTGDAGPLSDEALARVVAGDIPNNLVISSGFRAGGQLGNATRVPLVPGKYAFTTHAPTGIPFAPGELSVLTVIP